MRDVKAIDRLHETANRFLEEVGISEAVVAESLGNVGREANVGGSEPVLVMDIAVTESANGDDFRTFIRAVFADELSHGPRFERWPDGTQFARKMAEQDAHELALAVPETRKQLALFFRSEEVGRKSRWERFS
jgi:hypothetical protein